MPSRKHVKHTCVYLLRCCAVVVALMVPVCFYHSADCYMLWLGTLSLGTVSHVCCQDQHWLIVNFTEMNTLKLY